VSLGTYLDRIVAAHRARSERDDRDRHALLEAAEASPPTRGFADHIASSAALAVIAEIKRRSPSKGDISPRLHPAEVAVSYAEGGARCLSVLTDEEFFGGSSADLEVARGACELPVLRKDFTVSELDVCDARIMGADSVLLIVGALEDEELVNLHSLAVELTMDPLVEVHDRNDLERALEIGAELIGVNQRDLRTFEVDDSRAEEMAGSMPPEVIAVAESGISGPEDARRLAESGYQAVLVGEWLLRAADRQEAVHALGAHRVGSRTYRPAELRGSVSGPGR
jgi:indole-3-glycerol phosphate synthase